MFLIVFLLIFLSFGLHVCNQWEGEDVRNSTPQNKEPGRKRRRRRRRGWWGGGVDARPLNYLFAPLLFRHWKRKPKKRSAKGKR